MSCKVPEANLGSILVRKSADTQEYELCQRNVVEVNMGEDKRELNFVPSAVTSSVGWREPQFN